MWRCYVAIKTSHSALIYKYGATIGWHEGTSVVYLTYISLSYVIVKRLQTSVTSADAIIDDRISKTITLYDDSAVFSSHFMTIW